jgi:hypothetical protein
LGTETKVVCWIYTAVVRPIAIYAANIWWPRVKFKTSQAELSKLQRMACLGITGVMRTAPTAAMEVLLGLPPLHLYVEVEAKIRYYRLHCNEQWISKSEGFGHAYMTRDMEKVPILQMWSDKMIVRHVYDKPFMIRFPTEVNGRRGFNPIESGEGANLIHRWLQDK